MAEPLFSVPKKKAKTSHFQADVCIFCKSRFTTRDPAVSPDLKRIEPLFAACRDRQDEVGQELLRYKNDIYKEKICIQYHRNCRSSYTSPQHIASAQKQTKCSTGNKAHNAEKVSDSSETVTRSKVEKSFDWKSNVSFVVNSVFQN